MVELVRAAEIKNADEHVEFRLRGRSAIGAAGESSRDFANGEIFVRFEESVRGSDAFVLQSHPAPLNTWVMEQLIMIDALKRGSAKRITAVLPFYPYARQDKKHRGREPISARLIADLLKTAGADRIITVDLHTDQIQGFFDGPVDHMHAHSQLANHIRAGYNLENITVVSPDSGRVRVAEKWADSLGGAPLAFIHKTRDPLVPNQVKSNRVVGEVEGRTCILIDDMIDTGGTIVKAAETLFLLSAGKETTPLAKVAGEPAFSSETKLDPAAPLGHTPEELAKAYKLESVEWTWTPESPKFVLRLPEMSPHTVVLWLDDQTKPATKPRWVMMIAEDESPLIVAAPSTRREIPWWVDEPFLVLGAALAGTALMWFALGLNRIGEWLDRKPKA